MKKPQKNWGANNFAKDPERARRAGKMSKRSPEVEAAVGLFAVEFKATVLKYLDSDISKLKKIMQDPTTKAVDLIVIKLMVKAIESGDQSRLDFLLNRTVGRVKENLDLNVSSSPHKSIVEQIAESRDVTSNKGDDEND